VGRQDGIELFDFNSLLGWTTEDPHNVILPADYSGGPPIVPK